MPAPPAGDGNDKKKQKGYDETAFSLASAGRRPRGREALATALRMPVTGLEAEFNVLIDGVEIDPRKYWVTPGAFIDAPLLKRERSSFQLPTGGAVYFDRGVIEVVTPVIELAPGCTARVVRNLWEQIGFVRNELTKWEGRQGRDVRLKAYSTHYNVSFELRPEEQGPDRNVKSLALLLAYILPVPVAVVGTNRRSTGVGVRPRGNRIEVTADFTPDPGLMIATATLVLGIVREVMSWPSYALSMLDTKRVPVVADVVPGKHTTRKGWLTKDFNFPQSPFTSDIDARIWRTRDGRTRSLRQMARETAWMFRRTIRRHSDPFSFRLLFAILRGRSPSLLELPDRPNAYEDVGRLCRWGMVIAALRTHDDRRKQPVVRTVWNVGTFQSWVESRDRERAANGHGAAHPAVAAKPETVVPPPAESPAVAVAAQAEPASPVRPRTRAKRASASPAVDPAAPAAPDPAPNRPARRGTQRRARTAEAPAPKPVRRAASTGGRDPRSDAAPQRRTAQRRTSDRRTRKDPIPFPDRRLTRSAYEQVFLKLVSGGRLRIGRELYTPVGMKGWYHAILRRDSDGKERLLSVDQLLKKLKDWR
jgi:hypothetical protein